VLHVLSGLANPHWAQPEVLEALASDDAALRQAATVVLGRIRPVRPDTVAALGRVLQDADLHVAGAAARALGRLGPAATSTTVALLDAMRQPDPDLQIDAALALLALGLPPARVSPPLAALLRTCTGETRLAIWSELVGQGARAVPVIIQLLQIGAEPSEALEALQLLGHEARAATPCLVSFLDDPDPRSCILAATLLGTLGEVPATAIGLLRRMHDDPYHWVAKLSYREEFRREQDAAGFWPSATRRQFRKLLAVARDAPRALPQLARLIRPLQETARTFQLAAALALAPHEEHLGSIWPTLGFAIASHRVEPGFKAKILETVSGLQGHARRFLPCILAALSGGVLGECLPETEAAILRLDPGGRLAYEDLERLVRHRLRTVRRVALRVLGVLGRQGRPVAGLLRYALDDPDDEAREIASQALWQLEEQPQMHGARRGGGAPEA
jgi:HEAT repeat protein